MLIEHIARLLRAHRICRAFRSGPAEARAIGFGLQLGLRPLSAFLETFQV
jgi:hypothetical protein